MRITSDELDGQVEQEQPSYSTGQTQTTAQTGQQGAQGSLQKYNGILSEVNQLLQQLDNLGIMQNPAAQGQQPQQGPAPQTAGQPGAQGQQQQQQQASEQQQAQQQDMDQLVDQSYRQLMQFVNLMQGELGEDASLNDTEKYMVENEQGLKSIIKQQIEAQM